MTARELFKDIKAQGKVLKCGKGGYKDDTFAYRISDNGTAYFVEVLSVVNPRTYTVEKKEGTNVYTLENAILYNEYVSRVQANKRM